MGDGLATIDIGRKEGGGRCTPFEGGELGPHLTLYGELGPLSNSVAWAEAYRVVS